MALLRVRGTAFGNLRTSRLGHHGACCRRIVLATDKVRMPDGQSRALSLFLLTGLSFPYTSFAQQPAQQLSPLSRADAPTIATVSIEGVTLSGPLTTSGGRAALGNNSTVTAGEQSAQISLARGGSLRVCASTSVHLSRDAQPLSSSENASAGTSGAKDDAGLMLALDRGALEAEYPTGKYSDVVLTPDLRILVSGPGTADLKLRVTRQGDTCVDNHGDNAPYITVSSLMDGGVYRVQANQRVLFEHGSLQQVVDREAESCGCPAPASTQIAGSSHLGGPSSAPSDTNFPLAVSEGLATAPSGPTEPIVQPGQAHAQVTASLSSNTPLGPPPAAITPKPEVSRQPETEPTAAPRRGFLGRIGHFFSRLLKKG